MISKFYNNQPEQQKSKKHILQNSVNYCNQNPVTTQNQKKLTNLTEARIKNRSESRQKMQRSIQHNPQFNASNIICSKLLNNQSLPSQTNIQGLNQNSLDETLQVVKDLLQLRRNQSQTNVNFILNQSSHVIKTIPVQQHSVNQSGVFNQGMPVFQQNQMQQRKGSAITENQQSKENIAEFLQIYETFKKDGDLKRTLGSPQQK